MKKSKLKELDIAYQAVIDKVDAIEQEIAAIPNRGGMRPQSFSDQRMKLRMKLMIANAEAVEIDRQRNYLEPMFSPITENETVNENEQRKRLY